MKEGLHETLIFSGISSAKKSASTPTAIGSRKTLYGSQVPGKPSRNNAMLNEMQSKLQKRKEKVDKEAYVVQTPENALPPTGLRGRSPSTEGDGGRRYSRDSGRHSWTPCSDYDPQRRISVDYSQYRKVSVDLDRKEELRIAKAVRKSSAKILGRGSPSMFEQGCNETVIKPVGESPIPQANIPPPSPVVMRYWKQCSSGAMEDTENNNDEDESGKHKLCYL